VKVVITENMNHFGEKFADGVLGGGGEAEAGVVGEVVGGGEEDETSGSKTRVCSMSG
jgi:hypothetical protein